MDPVDGMTMDPGGGGAPDPISTQGSDPSSAMIPGIDTTAAPVSSDHMAGMEGEHRGRVASLLDQIGGILGGSNRITMHRDDDGKMVVERQPLSIGQKWAAAAATALSGAAAGMSVRNGPGNLSRAAAAGAGVGLNQGQADQDRQRALADDDFQKRQAAQLHQGQMALLNQRVSAGAFDATQRQQAAMDGTVQRQNDLEKMLSENPGATLIGNAPTPADLPALLKKQPTGIQDHATGQIMAVPHVGEDGKYAGVDYYHVPKQWKDLRTATAATRSYRSTDDDGNDVLKKDVVPAGAMTNGEFAAMHQADSAGIMAYHKEQHELALKDAKEKSEEGFQRSEMARNFAEAGRAGAEAGKARAETGGIAGAAADADETQAQQIAAGEVKPLNQSRLNPRNQAIMRRVYEINPKYSDSIYTATQDIRSSKPNTSGANVQRLGTAVLHGDRALTNSHALGFSEGLLTGVKTSGTAAYKQDAEFLTGEIGQYVTGGKLTVDEGKKLSADLMASRQSVRDSAIHEVIQLSGGKLRAQMQQFTNATGNPLDLKRVFNDPDIHDALQRHGVLAAPAAAAPAGAQAEVHVNGKLVGHTVNGKYVPLGQ